MYRIPSSGILITPAKPTWGPVLLGDSFLKSQNCDEDAPSCTSGLRQFTTEWGTYRHSMRPRDGGETVLTLGKLMRILQRQRDGSWKMHRGIASVDARSSDAMRELNQSTPAGPEPLVPPSHRREGSCSVVNSFRCGGACGRRGDFRVVRPDDRHRDRGDQHHDLHGVLVSLSAARSSLATPRAEHCHHRHHVCHHRPPVRLPGDPLRVQAQLGWVASQESGGGS